MTYLGAIRALETMGILPIDITRPGANQIQGISGASAGAITALLLSMGLTARQLEQVLKQSSTFTGFFDGPAPGTYRLVDRRGRSTVGGRARVRNPSTASAVARGMLPVSAALIDVGGGALVDLLLGQFESPIADRIRMAPMVYLDNLMLDRGLFPGFAPRVFFRQMMARYLSRRILQAAGGNFKQVTGPETIGFAKFHELTGVDLVITGVNVTKHRPAMYSRRLTPDFPVADAVANSMTLPVLFKPALIDAEVPVSPFNDDPTAYQGFWVDGGVLNNLPLHAFDGNFMDPGLAQSGSEPLNDRVVALRLTPGRPPGSALPMLPPDPDIVGLGAFLGAFAETLMYPSEDGQVRSAVEADQTIDLYTFELSTTDFAPPESKSREPIAYAEQRVLSYFNPGLY